jgi:solute carrier family 13 (sodium-dependent dicarboxylate transporter), member 2/3/5
MRTVYEATAAVEAYSPAEERFNRRRRAAGMFLAPMAFVFVLVLPLETIAPPAHRLAAIVALVGVLWITEALPLAVSAMLGPVLAVILRVAPAKVALAPFADPIIFLFIGSFMLAEAMFVHGLDRRIAYAALASRAVGASPARLVVVYAAVGTGISMFVSNMASAAMIFPIGLAIITYLAQSPDSKGKPAERFALAVMLLTSFAPSVGGMATPVGTPPNLIGIGMLERHAGYKIPFFGWVAVGLPIVAVLFGYLIANFSMTCLRGLSVGASSRDMVGDEFDKLGPLSRGQRNVAVAFGLTVLLWIAPGLFAIAGLSGSAFGRAYAEVMPEGVAAMVGAILLFLLPVDWRSRRFTLTWGEAVRIDWGVILLYGGGLALGELVFSSGLAEAVGRGLIAWLPSHTSFTLTVMFAAFAILSSEVTSNTASATLIVPIAIAVSQAAGIRPIEPALAATFGSSMGFVLPVSTAPNALVYSSGYVPITSMMRHGLALDLAAFLVIVTSVTFLAPVVF